MVVVDLEVPYRLTLLWLATELSDLYYNNTYFLPLARGVDSAESQGEKGK